MKFPVKLLSEGEPKNVTCGGDGQLSVIKEQIVVWEIVSSYYVKKNLKFEVTEDHQVLYISHSEIIDQKLSVLRV